MGLICVIPSIFAQSFSMHSLVLRLLAMNSTTTIITGSFSSSFFFFIVSSKLLKPSYSLFHSFIHGRLPYEKLKSDPVLRSLLLSLPLRKIVSFIEHLTINYILFPCTFFKSSYDIQLFSNLRMTFILSATRYSPMRIRSMLLELLANWGWKIVLKELFALKH